MDQRPPRRGRIFLAPIFFALCVVLTGVVAFGIYTDQHQLIGMPMIGAVLAFLLSLWSTWIG
jgi:ABC-type transport system involved in cytochrome c biogenesis permease component